MLSITIEVSDKQAKALSTCSWVENDNMYNQIMSKLELAAVEALIPESENN